MTSDPNKITNYEHNPVLHFGKYSGKKVSELPESYLKYLLTIAISDSLRYNVF